MFTIPDHILNSSADRRREAARDPAPVDPEPKRLAPLIPHASGQDGALIAKSWRVEALALAEQVAAMRESVTTLKLRLARIAVLAETPAATADDRAELLRQISGLAQ